MNIRPICILQISLSIVTAPWAIAAGAANVINSQITLAAVLNFTMRPSALTDFGTAHLSSVATLDPSAVKVGTIGPPISAMCRCPASS